MFICLYFVDDHLHFITPELNSCDLDHMAHNVFYRKTDNSWWRVRAHVINWECYSYNSLRMAE